MRTGGLRAAQMKTAWGRRCQRRFALVEGADLLASAEQYDLDGSFEGRAVRICGHRLGVHRSGAARPRSCADADRDAARSSRAEGRGDGAPVRAARPRGRTRATGFDAIPLTEATLLVEESPRHGAPMTMVRGGEERDLAAIVAMGRVRADPFRPSTSIATSTWFSTRSPGSGCSPVSARRPRGSCIFSLPRKGQRPPPTWSSPSPETRWTLEECGDRDPSGARVGALLQALIAREPDERRPTIRGWLPPGFLPPQVTIVAAVAFDGDRDGARPQLDDAAAVRRRGPVLAQRRFLT